MSIDSDVKAKFDLLTSINARSTDLTRTELATLFAIGLRARFEGGAWIAWPSQGRLAVDIGLPKAGRNQIQRAIASLRSKALLESDATDGRLTYQVTIAPPSAQEDPTAGGDPAQLMEASPPPDGPPSPPPDGDLPHLGGTIIIKEQEEEQLTNIEAPRAASVEQLEIEPTAPSKSRIDTLTESLFEYWKSETNRPRSKLDKTRRRDLKTAIHEYGFEKCKQAISGMAKDDFAMGVGKDRKYNEPKHCFSKAERFEHFLSLHEESEVSFDLKAAVERFNFVFNAAFSKLSTMDGDERVLAGHRLKLDRDKGVSVQCAQIALTSKKIAADDLKKTFGDKTLFLREKELRAAQAELDEEINNDAKRANRRRNRKSDTHASRQGHEE